MSNIHIIILYSLLLLLSSQQQLKIWKREKISAFFIFHATFVLYYVLLPITIYLFSGVEEIVRGKFTGYILKASFEVQIRAFIYTIIAYLCLSVVYRYKNIFSKKTAPKGLNVRFSYNIIFYFGIFFLVVGGGSVILFFDDLGGFQQALTFADTLRYSKTDSSQYYGAMTALYRMLAFLVMGGAYCFKICLNERKKFHIRILFWSSFILSIMYLLFNSGRATIIFFLVPFVLENVIKKGKRILITLVVMFVAVMLTAQVFDIILYQMTTGSINISSNNTSVIQNVFSAINDLSFPYSNTLLVDKMNKLFDYRMGKDYYIWIFDIVPSRLFETIGIQISETDTLNKLTSSFYYILNPYSYGGVPTDFITLGIREGGILGLIFNSTIFAIFAVYIDKISAFIGNKYSLVIIRIQMMFFSLITNNDLTDIVRGNLFIFIMIIMIFVVHKKIKKIAKRYSND